MNPTLTFGTILLAISLGCSGETRVLPERSEVTGQVTVNGEPLESGSISFSSEEDTIKGISSSADIKNGQYKAKVTLGEKTVRINSIVTVGTAEVEGWEDTKELIPRKYNTKSKLKATIGSGKSNLNFDLDVKAEAE